MIHFSHGFYCDLYVLTHLVKSLRIAGYHIHVLPEHPVHPDKCNMIYNWCTIKEHMQGRPVMAFKKAH